MGVARLLQALEEVIFEVACLGVLLPKTFFFLAFSPRKAYAYVVEELQKKPEERFDRFASPLILWSVAGILPHYIILSVFAANPTASKVLAANTDDLLLKMLALPAETRFVSLTILAVSLPLAFAVVIARERKQETARSSLREPLYTLCYCTAPVFLAATPLWALWEAKVSGVFPQAKFVLQPYGAALAFWIAWIGASLFRQHLGVERGRALLLLGKAYFVFFGVVALLEMGIILILGTLILGPH